MRRGREWPEHTNCSLLIRVSRLVSDPAPIQHLGGTETVASQLRLWSVLRRAGLLAPIGDRNHFSSRHETARGIYQIYISRTSSLARHPLPFWLRQELKMSQRVSVCLSVQNQLVRSTQSFWLGSSQLSFSTLLTLIHLSFISHLALFQLSFPHRFLSSLYLKTHQYE